MFVVISLVDDFISKVIPEEHIQDLNECKTLNYGINCNQKYRIFWSPLFVQTRDEIEAPDFNLPVRNVFDENIRACYIAKLVRFYGKYFFFNFRYD